VPSIALEMPHFLKGVLSAEIYDILNNVILYHLKKVGWNLNHMSGIFMAKYVLINNSTIAQENIPSSFCNWLLSEIPFTTKH
jgi:hypothetical protein